MRPEEISAIFAGGGLGAIAAALPVVYALNYFGPRTVFSALIAASALATLAMPTLARIGDSPLWMMASRVLQGAALSATLPLMGCVSAEWAPLSEVREGHKFRNCN